MMTGFDWGMAAGGWFWMVVEVVLAVVLVWALVVAIAGRDRPAADDAARILKARFERGELTQAERRTGTTPVRHLNEGDGR